MLCAPASPPSSFGSRTASVACSGFCAPLAMAKDGGPVPVHHRNGSEVVIDGSTYRASLHDGVLVGLSSNQKGKQLFSDAHGSPLDHVFWRAGTDNDRGGADVFFPQLAFAMPRSMLSYSRQWKAAGLEDAKTRIVEHRWDGKELFVSYEHGVKGKSPLFRITTTTAFRASDIRLKMKVTPCRGSAISKLPCIPRVGVRLVLAPELSNITWLGRGPHECYPDRKASAHFNVHRSTVEKMHFPYMVPGECGGVADVQWVALQDSEGRGLLVEYSSDDPPAAEECNDCGNAGCRPAAMCGAQVSTARWIPAMAHAAAHDFEILPQGQRREDQPVVLHVDTAHTGIGGEGGLTEAVWRFYDQYSVDPGTPEWNYSIVLTPLEPGQLEVAT